METYVHKRNCKDKDVDVYIDWDGWLVDALWVSGGWFDETDAKLRQAFPGANFPRIPPEPARLEHTVKHVGQFRAGLQASTTNLRDWARGTTVIVSGLHQAILADPDLAIDDPARWALTLHFRYLLQELDGIQKIPNPGSSNATGMCGPFAQWARGFSRWGINLHLWENLAASLPDRPAIRQVPPPPWPPWKPYGDELPDSDGVHLSFVGDDDEHSETR